MISVAAATGFVEAVEKAGRDPDRILESRGLDRKVFADPHGFIPAQDFADLLEDAARLTGDDCFGLHFGEQFHPKDIGPLAYVILNSPTVAVGIENVARYQRMHNEAARVSFTIGQKWAYLRHQLVNLSVESPRQHNEYSMAVALGTIRLMVGSGWSPVEVQFQHPAPPETSEHERVFSAPVSFDHDANALVLEPEFCERQVPAADARLYRILKENLDQALDELPPDNDLVASVRKLIAHSLGQGAPPLAQVARALAIGPRTLQRRLKECGVDFHALVDDTRHRCSLRYLADPKNTLTEIAYLLGYSEVSAFNRAFRRWVGSTPTEYRRTVTRR